MDRDDRGKCRSTRETSGRLRSFRERLGLGREKLRKNSERKLSQSEELAKKQVAKEVEAVRKILEADAGRWDRMNPREQCGLLQKIETCIAALQERDAVFVMASEGRNDKLLVANTAKILRVPARVLENEKRALFCLFVAQQDLLQVSQVEKHMFNVLSALAETGEAKRKLLFDEAKVVRWARQEYLANQDQSDQLRKNFREEKATEALQRIELLYQDRPKRA